jgi:ferredoxin/flavodoxin---NADP+ reductase
VFRVVCGEQVAPSVTRLEVEAARVSRHWRPGQFVILRPDTSSERIPLTVADVDREAGTITLYVQAVGRTTRLLSQLRTGEAIADISGPLGRPHDAELWGTVVAVAGGLGAAIIHPLARASRHEGNTVIGILGARSRDLLILEAELGRACHELRVVTEDGSAGRQGLVTDVLADLLAEQAADLVLAAGPVPMMAAVAEVTRGRDVPTLCSLNPIMVDGTGMCGGCRVEVGGRTRFACIDGPEFDAHEVDFDLLAKRNLAYRHFERRRDAELQACLAVGRP